MASLDQNGLLPQLKNHVYHIITDNFLRILNKNKKCIHEGCGKHPVFNLPTETTALYCFEHKKENMIDIKHKR